MEDPDVISILWQIWLLIKPLLTAPAYYGITWLSEFFETGPGFLVTAVEIFISLLIYKILYEVFSSFGGAQQ